MVTLSIKGSLLRIEVLGMHKIWAMKGSLEIPLEKITAVRVADPDIVKGWWKGIRLPGTHLPGVIVAGTYYEKGEKIFWDVHDGTRAIEIETEDFSYDRIIVEVKDPDRDVAAVASRLTVPAA